MDDFSKACLIITVSFFLGMLCDNLGMCLLFMIIIGLIVAAVDSLRRNKEEEDEEENIKR